MPTVIANPNYTSTHADLDLLTRDVQSDVLGLKPKILSPNGRRALSRRLTADAVNVLISMLPSSACIAKKNRQKFEINGKYLIYKGCTFVENVEFTIDDDLRNTGTMPDVFVLAHIGSVVDGRVGRLRGFLSGPTASVDYYVVPREPLERMIANRLEKGDVLSKVYQFRHNGSRSIGDNSSYKSEEHNLLSLWNRVEILTTFFAL